MAYKVVGKAENYFLEFRNSRIHYLKFGHGKTPLVALHGFSENAGSFIDLSPALEEIYTVYAIDMPYHGYTEWREAGYMDKPLLEDMIGKFLEKENIGRFSLFGFSMGGRISLSLVHIFPERILELFLAAPDGIRTHKIFDVAVYPFWGRWIFKQVMRKPGIFFWFTRSLFKIGRLNKFLYEFTMNHLDSQEKRDRVLHTWLTIKNFRENIPATRELLNTHDIPVFLIFGKKDKVIKPAVGRYFQKGLNNSRLYVVPRGHFLITSSFVPHLEKILAER